LGFALLLALPLIILPALARGGWRKGGISQANTYCALFAIVHLGRNEAQQAFKIARVSAQAVLQTKTIVSMDDCESPTAMTTAMTETAGY
jgi:hypothetical protein